MTITPDSPTRAAVPEFLELLMQHIVRTAFTKSGYLP